MEQRCVIAADTPAASSLLAHCFLAVSLALLPSLAQAVTFAASGTISAGGVGIGQRIVFGDFDNDGFIDFANTPFLLEDVAGGDINGINVIYGNGSGGVKDNTSIGAGWGGISDLAMADLNGDGILDMVVTEAFIGIRSNVGDPPYRTPTCQSLVPGVPVWLGQSNGTYVQQTCLTVPPYTDFGTGYWYPGAVNIGDFNSDGIPDVIVMNAVNLPAGVTGIYNLYYFQGNGDGTFQPGITQLSSGGTWDLIPADLDLDGALDAVSSSQRFIGRDNGGFSGTAAGSVALGTAVGDVNGDGVPDLAAIYNTSGISVLLGAGDGSFTAAPGIGTLPLGSQPADVAIADLNGDGLGDLVAADTGNDEVMYYLSQVAPNGVLSFATLQSVAAGANPVALGVVDWNHDGCPDVMALNMPLDQDTNPMDGTITALLQQSCGRPVAMNDAVSTMKNAAISIHVLDNDSDPAGGTLSPASLAVVRQPLHGSANLPGDGTIQYTPAAGYMGADNFTYRVQNNTATDSNVAQVDVHVKSANQRPVAMNDAASIVQNTPTAANVLTNDADADGSLDPTTVTVIARHGAYQDSTASAGATGQITVAPRTDFSGPLQFQYYVSDNEGRTSNLATLSVDVLPAQPPPIASDDRVRARGNLDVVIRPKDNDVARSGTLSNSFRLSSATPTANGGWVWIDYGRGTMTYSAPLSGVVYGVDSFTYQVADSYGGYSNSATVYVDVVNTNIVGDLNADSRLDSRDLGMLMSKWGTTDVHADINLDGTVDAQDLAAIAGNLPCVGAANCPTF